MPRLGDCDRCFDLTSATNVQTIAFGATKVKLKLCESHGERLHNDMLGWLRVGEVVEEAITFRPTVAEEDRARARQRVTPPRAKPRAVVVDDDDRDERLLTMVQEDRRRAPVRSPQLPMNFEKWGITDHARERMEQRGVSDSEVLWACASPDTIRPNRDPQYGDSVVIHQRGHVQVVVNPNTFEVVTVINRNITEERHAAAQ